MNLFKNPIERNRQAYRTIRPVIASGTISVLVCGLPLLLLLDPRSVFDFDWFNHLWMMEYFGEYIRQHGVLPLC
jgi:hypothetical protein